MALPPAFTPTDGSRPQRPQVPRTFRNGFIFGVPMGDLGWFATVLMSASLGFAAFFAATFLGIVGLLFYNTSLHHTADYAISYRLIGLPVGLVVLVVSTIYLGSLWVRRILRHG